MKVKVRLETPVDSDSDDELTPTEIEIPPLHQCLGANNMIKIEWLRAHKAALESNFESWESGNRTPPEYERFPALPARDQTSHEFEPALTKQDQIGKDRKKEPELGGVGKVSDGGEESDNLEGRFTNLSKKHDSRGFKNSTVKSLEQRESEIVKRLCEFDFLSETSDTAEGDNRIARRRKHETIGVKDVNACDGPFSDSSTDIPSSVLTSVLVAATEETELSDDNEKSDKSSFSEMLDTARKMSSSYITLVEDDDDVEYIDAEEIGEIVVPDAGSRDEHLENIFFLFLDRPQNIATSESQPEPQTSDNVNDDKPLSEEVNEEIQTPAKILSIVVDDSADLIVPEPVKSLDDEKSGQESISTTSTAKASTPLEKHLLSPKSETSSQKTVEKLTRSDDSCKHGPMSPKESIAPSNVAKTKSEIETDGKKKQRSKSESSASKKGSTSSDKFPSAKRDASKNRDHRRRSTGEKRPKPRRLTVSTEISSRDRIQNIISDKKSMKPGQPSPCKSNSKCCVIAKLHALFCEKHKNLRMPVDESESDKSCRSGNTDSTTLPELDRISERLLPIRGTLTLIKGKADRSPTSSWGSVSSLLEDLTWKKRDENDQSNSLMSSFSTLFIQTQIQVDVHREMSSKSTIYDETKPPKGIYSESDTSSEYSQCKDMRITCEKVIKGTLSNNTDIYTKSQYCINSITFGLRRSLSDETLCPIEVYTPEEPKVRSPPGNLFNPNNCDACIFLLLIETLIVREKNIHLSNRKTDACLVHNVYLDYENSHIHHHLLKKMPLCDHCNFPSVEKTILQLVRYRHGVLIHKDDGLAPIYAMIPSYSDENETIGRIVHLTKKNVMDFGHKSADFCPISVKIADRYILFPKLIDTSVWARFRLKRRDTPYKKPMSKIKCKNVQPMEDIPELNENINEDSRVKVKPERQTIKVAPKKKRPSKRKAKKCVAKKRSVQTTSATQPSRKNGSSSDTSGTSKNTVMSPPASISTADSDTTSTNGKRKRCVLKKWPVKLSPKSQKKIVNKNEKQVATKDSSKVSKSTGADKLPKSKPKRKTTSHKSRAKKKGDKPIEQIDGIVLVRKRRPWWKCPKKEDEEAKKKSIEAARKKNLEYYKKFIHPTYQQPFYSYIFKSPKGRYWETNVVTRQDVLAQRLAYHYLRRLTLHRSGQQKHSEKIKSSLTDFQSFKYEERRAVLRNSIRSESITSDELDLNESQEKEHDVEDYFVEELTTSEQEPESSLNLAEYDLSKIEYHFEDCPIIQAGATPYKHFLKLLEVHKTSSEESWIEYHVEDCSYYLIDGNTVDDFKVVDLVLVEKKNDTICDCAEKLIKGANTYQQDSSSQMFHHDLCLLFPHQMEIGDIDLQSLFHPNIPSRQFHKRDFLRFYFISKSPENTEETPVINYRDVPISKFEQVQKNIKITLSQLDQGQAGTSADSLPCTSPVASTSTQTTIKTYQLVDGDDIESILHHRDEELSEDQFILSPPRADSESEDSDTVYSLEECLLFANEHLTDDSMSTSTPDLTEGIEYQNLSKHSEEYSPSGSAYSISQFAISPRASILPQDFKSIHSGKTITLPYSQIMSPPLKPQEGETAGKHIKTVEAQPSTSKDSNTSLEPVQHIPVPEVYMSILKRRFKSHEDLSTFDDLIEDDTRALSALPPIMMDSPRQDDQGRSQEEQECLDCEWEKLRKLREQFGASEASYKRCGVLGHSFCYEYPLAEELLPRESLSAPCPGTYHEIASQAQGYRRQSSLTERIAQTSQSDPSDSDMQLQDASDDDHMDSLPWHPTNG